MWENIPEKMWNLFSALFVLCLMLNIEARLGQGRKECYQLKAEDVCNAPNKTNKIMPHLSSRAPDVLLTEQLYKWKFCDVFAIDTGQWYYSSIKMTEACPKLYGCGTKYPIWLKGTNPKPEEGLVERWACLREYDLCCLRKYRIVVVNCGDTMAYCFNELPSGCHQRYCFGESKKNRYRATIADVKSHKGVTGGDRIRKLNK